MAYATLQDLIDAYGAQRIEMLAQQAPGVIDEAKVSRALDGASAVIDGYLSLRYALPLPAAPATLADACAVIAFYRLASEPGSLTEDMRARYDDAIAFLKDVARGVAGIGLPTLAQQQGAGSAANAETASPQTVIIDGNERLFTRQSLRTL